MVEIKGGSILEDIAVWIHNVYYSDGHAELRKGECSLSLGKFWIRTQSLLCDVEMFLRAKTELDTMKLRTTWDGCGVLTQVLLKAKEWMKT